MNCELYDDLLDDYVDGMRASGHPGDARFAAFELHLAGCTRCQALVADLKVQTDAMAKVMASDLPAFNKEAMRLGLTQIK